MFSYTRHISVPLNVKFTVDEVQLLLRLEFWQNAADFVSFTPVGRTIPTKKISKREDNIKHLSSVIYCNID